MRERGSGTVYHYRERRNKLRTIQYRPNSHAKPNPAKTPITGLGIANQYGNVSPGGGCIFVLGDTFVATKPVSPNLLPINVANVESPIVFI